MMVHETTCGLSFQLANAGIDDVIEDGWKVSTTNMIEGKLQSVDGKIWKNYGPLTCN
jgi:hypothetical protein